MTFPLALKNKNIASKTTPVSSHRSKEAAPTKSAEKKKRVAKQKNMEYVAPPSKRLRLHLVVAESKDAGDPSDNEAQSLEEDEKERVAKTRKKKNNPRLVQPKKARQCPMCDYW